MMTTTTRAATTSREEAHCKKERAELTCTKTEREEEEKRRERRSRGRATQRSDHSKKKSLKSISMRSSLAASAPSSRLAPRRMASSRPATTAARAAPVDVDVAIVGGGPAGLAAALAIERASPSTRVAVFERARVLRPVGFTIGMMGTSTSRVFRALSVPASGILIEGRNREGGRGGRKKHSKSSIQFATSPLTFVFSSSLFLPHLPPFPPPPPPN